MVMPITGEKPCHDTNMSITRHDTNISHWITKCTIRVKDIQVFR